MRAARFSLAALLVWMAMIAVGCQALVSHTPVWTYVVVSATVAMFGLALLAAMVSSGGRRAYLLGFAVAGGGYVLLAVHPSLSNVGEQLLTTRALLTLWNELIEPSPGTPSTGAAWGSPSALDLATGMELTTDGARDDDSYTALVNDAPLVALASRQNYRSKRSYLFIGQCLWGVLLACPAGLFCCWLHERRVRRERAEEQFAQGMAEHAARVKPSPSRQHGRDGRVEPDTNA